MQCQYGAQFVERIAIHPFWVIDEFRYFHLLFTFSLFTIHFSLAQRLSPVRHCCIEYLVANVLTHLCYQIFLYRLKRQRGFI